VEPKEEGKEEETKESDAKPAEETKEEVKTEEVKEKVGKIKSRDGKATTLMELLDVSKFRALEIFKQRISEK